MPNQWFQYTMVRSMPQGYIQLVSHLSVLHENAPSPCSDIPVPHNQRALDNTIKRIFQVADCLIGTTAFNSFSDTVLNMMFEDGSTSLVKSGTDGCDLS